tara:strand:- start:257 stop:865 length:609 start_codon:yes stop_codon:yes gene_type:complete
MGVCRRLIFLIAIISVLVVGCETTGQAFLGAGGEVLFDVNRVMSGNAATLIIIDELVAPENLVVVVEKLPEGSEFIVGGFSLEPAILSDDHAIAMWILSPGAQNLPQFQIAGGIPSSISYEYSGDALSCSAITGKYGVDDGTGVPFEDTTGCVGEEVSQADEPSSDDGVTFAQFSQALTDFGAGTLGWPAFSQILTDYINSN